MRALLLLLFPAAAAGQTATERALAYLAREVPQWSKENHCFSCHNNGDGARALYVARRLSYRVSDPALRDTTQWLKRPSEWDNNRGDPRFSDKKLARIQFAASLAEAFAAGLAERASLAQAAESLLPDQEADGSWQVDAEAAVGSPVTYGATLATYMARRVLAKAGADRFRAPIERAERWLLEAPVNSVPNAAAVLLALETDAKRQKCLELILDAQASDGGWGPYRNAPSEVFDTALAVLALQAAKDVPEVPIRRGRDYLIRTQLPSGGWVETTRPSGGRSYAQHISTTGWAALALMICEERNSKW